MEKERYGGEEGERRKKKRKKRAFRRWLELKQKLRPGIDLVSLPYSAFGYVMPGSIGCMLCMLISQIYNA